MSEGIHCEILSTVETIQIEPDARIDLDDDLNPKMECRICLEGTVPLIVPCKCDGTMKYVHQKCLKKWAVGRLKRQVQKDQQKAKGQLSSVHGIACQLCKTNIAMKVQKSKNILKWDEAKSKTQQNFLPFLPLVVVNFIISLVCAASLVFVIAFSLLVIFESSSIDVKKYHQHRSMMWVVLILAAIFSVVFMIKSVIELYHIFVNQQFDVVQILPTLNILTSSGSQSIKTTMPDCAHMKEFNQIDSLSTPATPLGNDQIFQNRLSLTRKKINLQRKIARQIAQRKVSQAKDFSKEDAKPSPFISYRQRDVSAQSAQQ